VHARRLGLAALLAAVPLLSGCGSGAATDVAETTGGDLTIYSSLPLQGPHAASSEQLVDGEKLALSEAGGRAGRYRIAYESLDDAEPRSGRWSAGATATNAKIAAQDTSAIAYLGDYDSGATAVSLPLINGAGILQLSPASPYIGLTSSIAAGQDEPERFYPSGKRTFARLIPGDPVEAAAQVTLMRSLGVHSVYVLDDGIEDPFEVSLATILVGDAQRAGIGVPAHDSITTTTGSYSEEIHKIVHSGAQAVLVAAEAGAGTVALWQQLHSADPRLLLLGVSTMASEAFTSQLGAAAVSTYITTPLLSARMYPPSARHVFDAYRRTFASEATPEALYGYEAMNLVLDAIRAAGARGNDRQLIIDRVLATRERRSVLGRYSIKPSGETTLTRYGVDRVRGGRPVFYRAFAAAPLKRPAG